MAGMVPVEVAGGAGVRPLVLALEYRNFDFGRKELLSVDAVRAAFTGGVDFVANSHGRLFQVKELHDAICRNEALLPDSAERVAVLYREINARIAADDSPETRMDKYILDLRLHFPMSEMDLAILRISPYGVTRLLDLVCPGQGGIYAEEE